MTVRSRFIYQCQVFLLAIAIFTRIPVPASVPYSEDRKNESYKFSGAVGWVVGGLTAVIYMIAAQFWPQNVAVVLSMIASIKMTGAFHEDGFADSCDGFGGGFTPERKLEIMKDSRIGAYALIGMILVLLLKFTTLTALPCVPLVLIIAHALSRCVAVSFIYTHGYVRQIEQSKLKVARRPSQHGDFLTLMTTAFLTLFFIPSFKLALLLIVCLLILRLYLGRWLIKQIGGYTGDSLGAIQQVSELVCYLVFVAWFN